MEAKSKYSEIRNRLVFGALCTMLFVYGAAYMIIDIRMIFFFAAPICVYYILENKEQPFDLQFLFIFVASLIMAIIAFLREPGLSIYWSDVKLGWTFPVIYLLGEVAIGNDKENCDNRLYWALMSLNLGMYLQGVLNYVNKFFMPRDDYSWYAFWTHDYEARNVFDFGFILMMPTLYFAIRTRKEHLIRSIILFIAILVALCFTLSVEGRTLPCNMLFALLCSLIAEVISMVIRDKKRRKVVFITLATAIGCLVFLVLLFYANVAGIRDLYHNSFLARDGGIFHNVRYGIYKDALIKTITHPEGGWGGIYDGGYTHSTWFEIARLYNTFVFAFMMIFVFITLILATRLLFGNKWSSPIKHFLVGAVYVLFIYLTMEPQGATPRYYVMFFILIAGMVSRVDKIYCAS